MASPAVRRREVLGLGLRGPAASARRRSSAAAAAAREHLGFGAGGGGAAGRARGRRAARAAARRRRPRSSEICATDPYERARPRLRQAPTATWCGPSAGRFDHPPDVVAHPRDEGELRRLLEWCADAGAAAIPFGGGTSVVGGVEAALPGELRRRGHDRPAARSAACSRSTASRARRASRRAPPGPALEDGSCASTA